MTTQLRSSAPVAGDGSPTEQQHDAIPQPRFDAQDLRDISLHLNRMAEFFDNGGKPQAVDDHEATCLDIERIADDGETPDEIKTMGLPSPVVPKHRHRFFGAVIQIPIQSWWNPKSPRTTPPLLCDHLSLDLVRQVAVEFNERSIRRCKRSWSVVVRRRRKFYGVIKLPYVVSSIDRDPKSDHPEIEMRLMKAVEADNEAARLNESILRVSRSPKRWYVVAVPTS